MMNNYIKNFNQYLKTLFSYFFSKEFLIISFFTLWSVFILYNSDFLYPISMWNIFSTLSLFIVPVFFYISVFEEKKFIKIFYFIIFFSSLIISFYIVNLKGYSRNIGQNEFINGSMIIYFLLLIVYSFLNKNFHLNLFNLSMGDIKNSIIFTLISIIVITPLIIFTSRNPQFKTVYPLFKQMKNSNYDFIKYQSAFLYFFFFWEFYFRGIMLKSFEKILKNNFLAIILQSIIFTFIHFGKPGLETLSSFFGGFILGFFSIKLRTFLPSFILHYYIAFLMDFLSVFF